ncbi:MAG: YkgJ family cysteine cluster protein [Vampirovibrio sp.]|nr:YkgJ family cysteine cluster protein [Vampirovibrio sp.]
MSVQYQLSQVKQQYRHVFGSAQQAFFQQLDALKASFSCPPCDKAQASPELLEPFHPGCGYLGWQQQAVQEIENKIAKDILLKLQHIETEKQKISCHMCGVCCRLACSEFSFEDLQAKAAQGDEFARQFTSIFLPYASTKDARNNFPEVVDSILASAMESGSVDQDKSIHFYHCPYIGEDNRCTIYGSPKRPEICDSYPDTPLTFIYDKCAWKPWKDATHTDALLSHAMIELCTYTLDKLNHAISVSGSSK